MSFPRFHLRTVQSPPAWTLALGLIAVISGAVVAAEEIDTNARALTQHEAIALALSNNPDIAVAEFEIQRAKSRLRWSGRLENPELEISAADDVIDNRDNERSLEIAFSQRYPITSRLRDEKNVRRAQVLIAEAEIAEQRRQLAYQVDRASSELLASRAKQFLVRKLAKLNNEIIEFQQPSVARGEISSLDVTQTKLTGRFLDQRISLLSNQERQQSFALAKLLGIEATQKIRIKDGFRFPLTRPTTGSRLSDAQLFQRRPDHLLTLVQHDVAQAEALLAQAERWEDIAFKVFVEREQAVDAPDGLESNTFAGIGISIPLPIRQQNEGAIERAHIDTEAAEKSRTAREFHIRSEYQAALQLAIDSHSLAAEASGEVIELAEKNLEDYRRAYEQGQANLLQVQRAQEQVLELHQASLELVADYQLAEAYLRFVSGSYPGIQPTRIESGANK
jgi:cobalt-zinc-cadmium efflux system outer membrane protein